MIFFLEPFVDAEAYTTVSNIIHFTNIKLIFNIYTMKQDKVYRYFEYIKETINDVPEKYVENVFRKLKVKFEKMFSFDAVEDGEVKKFGEVKKDEEKSKKVSLSDFNLELQSCEFSKYSKIFDNLRVKFNDESYLYDLLITIDLKDAVPQDATKDFSDEDIKTCQLKFKKYDLDNFNLIGELIKTVDISKIDEDLLVELKLEIDQEYGEEEEEFEIETEEEGEEEPTQEEE
jgi:hypothetical protein